MFRVDHHHHHQPPVQPRGVQQLQLEGGGGAGDKHQVEVGRSKGEVEATTAGNINPHHRIIRLERSIAWLKDQHSQMVASLHNEIETLKHRNRGMRINKALSISPDRQRVETK